MASTFKQVTDKYIEWLQYGRPDPVTPSTLATVIKFNKQILKFFGDFPIQELTLDLVLRVKKKMLDNGNKISYIERALGYFRSLVRYLDEELGIDTVDPRSIKLPKRQKGPPEYCTQEELGIILNSIDTSTIQGMRLKALTILILSSGMRITEALSLNRDSIDRKERRAMILGKGGKYGFVFFHQWALNTLDKYLVMRTDNHEALFVSHYDSKNPTRWKDNCVRRYYSILSRELDIRVHPHKLRRTASTFFKHNGGDIYDISKFLRHSSLKITEDYIGVDYNKVQEAHEQFLHYGELTSMASSWFNTDIKKKNMPKPYIDVKTLQRVKELQEKGLKIAEIARVMQKDYKNIYGYTAFLKGDKRYMKKLPPGYGELSTDET